MRILTLVLATILILSGSAHAAQTQPSLELRVQALENQSAALENRLIVLEQVRAHTWSCEINCCAQQSDGSTTFKETEFSSGATIGQALNNAVAACSENNTKSEFVICRGVDITKVCRKN